MLYNFGKTRSKFFLGREGLADLADLADGNFFFLVDTDLAAILALAVLT